MGSGASKSKEEAIITQKAPDTEKENKNSKNDGSLEDKNTAKTNDNAKREDLRRTNQNANNNKQIKSGNTVLPNDGPMIALQNGQSDSIEVDQVSANQRKKDAKKADKELESKRQDEQRKKRDDEANKTARIGNLKEQLRRRVDDIMTRNDKVEIEFDTIKDLESDIRHFQKNHKYATLVDPIERRADLYQRYVKAKTRKAQLILRLSELAGARLKHNNPNIADISDENRASRLMAKFSELYDNEYTDLFEVYCAKLPENMDERKPIEHLRDSLKYCYGVCKDSATEQRKRLIFLLHMNNGMDIETAAVGLQLRIKEFQKNVAKFTITNLQSNVHTGITTVSSIKPLIDKTKASSTGSNPYLRHYLDRCTELCWYTQLQDPPVALDFGTRQSHGDYRAYTRSGPHMEYVVWPVLLLHENGPILFKGIAQFRKGDVTDDDKGTGTVRAASARMREANAGKRESKPFSHVPGEDATEFTKKARVSELETVDSDWN